MTPPTELPIAPIAHNPRRAGLRRYFIRFRRALVRGGCFTLNTPSIPKSGRRTSQIPTVDVNSASINEDSHPVSVPTRALSAVSVEVVSSNVDSTELALDGPRFFFRNVVQQQRVTTLFAKHGIPLEACEWAVLPAPAYKVQWVEKPVRMRIRRHCHRCQTTFGLDRTCKKCAHKLCKKCPRFPPRKVKETSGSSNAEGEEDGEADKELISTRTRTRLSSRQLLPPTKSRYEGSDLVRRPAKQKVRRTCHECSTIFARQEKVCRNCQHIRCTACPRDPPKIKKWPHGYPGDVAAEADDDPVPKDGREELPQVDEWSCHECSKRLAAMEKVCSDCEHTRCERCARHAPLTKPPPDLHDIKTLDDRQPDVVVSHPAAPILAAPTSTPTAVTVNLPV